MKMKSILNATKQIDVLASHFRIINEIWMKASDNSELDLELYFKKIGANMSYSEFMDMQTTLRTLTHCIEIDTTKELESKGNFDSIKDEHYHKMYAEEYSPKNLVYPLFKYLPYGRLCSQALMIENRYSVSSHDWEDHPTEDIQTSGLAKEIKDILSSIDERIFLSLDFQGFEDIYMRMLVDYDPSQKKKDVVEDIRTYLSKDESIVEWLKRLLSNYIALLLIWHVKEMDN